MSAPPVLTGTWFVTRTSLPMWRRWAQPTITYTPLPGGDVLDTVRSVRRGKVRLIVGIDRPLGQDGYEWRGLAPLTKLVRSRWEVLAADPAGEWAVTLFEHTPFTPAGLDVYTRKPWLLPDTEAEILRLLGKNGKARPFLPLLFTPSHG